MSYCLDLPSHFKIYHVFHVSLLRKAKGDSSVVVPLPSESYDTYPIVKPLAILDPLMIHCQG